MEKLNLKLNLKAPNLEHQPLKIQKVYNQMIKKDSPLKDLCSQIKMMDQLH